MEFNLCPAKYCRVMRIEGRSRYGEELQAIEKHRRLVSLFCRGVVQLISLPCRNFTGQEAWARNMFRACGGLALDADDLDSILQIPNL